MLKEIRTFTHIQVHRHHPDADATWTEIEGKQTDPLIHSVTLFNGSDSPLAYTRLTPCFAGVTLE